MIDVNPNENEIATMANLVIRHGASDVLGEIVASMTNKHAS